MHPEFRKPRFEPQDLRSNAAAREALVHYEGQPLATLEALRAQAELRARLERVQAADAWLRQQALAAGAAEDCPTAEELYEYGGGPGSGAGARALGVERRAGIDRHLAACPACESHVATLAAPPPSPLVDGLGTDGPHRTAAGRRPALLPPPTSVAQRRRGARWLLGAVAAGLAFAGGLALTRTERFAATDGYPVVDRLRGEADDALALPGGKVLVIDALVAQRFPALAQGVQLELRPGEQARSWRFDVQQSAADAPGMYERPLFRLDASGPSCVFRPAAHGLRPGDTFAWEVRAVQDGLVKFLGRRETTLVADVELTRALLAAADDLAALRLLHDGGWRTEALALARSLPPSGARDSYIEALLAR